MPAETQNQTDEIFISVDIECDGDIPGDYSMLSIGATTLGNEHERDFYVELRPMTERYNPQSLTVANLDRTRLLHEGVPAQEATAQFAAWIKELRELHGGAKAVCVTLSEWDNGWLYWYFVHFLGQKPLGFTGIDIKSYFMGKHDLKKFSGTYRTEMLKHYPSDIEHTHNALDDAREQAEIFWGMYKAQTPLS
jgi:hypothetical protein